MGKSYYSGGHDDNGSGNYEMREMRKMEVDFWRREPRITRIDTNREKIQRHVPRGCPDAPSGRDSPPENGHTREQTSLHPRMAIRRQRPGPGRTARSIREYS